MKKFILFLFLLLPFFSIAQNNINISNYNVNNAYDDAEPYIAVDPTNSNNVIAAWMKVTGVPPVSIAVSHSFDAGVTWSTPISMPSLYSSFTSADVSLAFSSSGTAYICYINYSAQFDSGYVMVANSTNNGQTWSTPVKVISGLESSDLPIDRPWIAIDKSGGPNNGKLYVVSKSAEAGALPHHIWMKTSSDGGLTWTPRLQIDNPSTVGFITNSMGTLDVGPEGNVYVAYISYDTAQFIFPRVLLMKSTNGGTSFVQHLIAYPVTGSGITDTLYQGSYCVKANPSNGLNLVFIVTDARNGDADILAVHSNDEGLTWNGTTPVRVNDDLPTNNGFGQDMCWGGFTPNGNYCAVWRDRRNGGAGSSANFELYTSVSTDGGASFKPNYRISTSSSPVIPIAKGNDFLGVALDNNYLYTDWCDKRTANTEIFTAKDTVAKLVSVNEVNSKVPFSINCFPNPYTAEITFNVKTSEEIASTFISIYDLNGKEIAELFSGKLPAGENKFQFTGAKLSSGDYILKIRSSKGTAEKVFTKMPGQ